MIDIGGPAMLRAAAKNFAHVVPVCRPEDYDRVLAELREPATSRVETRRELAARAFATTAAYEAAVARLVRAATRLPRDASCRCFDHALDLSYGENPHQRGGLLRRARRPHAPALARRAAPRASRSRSTTSTTSPPPGCSPLEFDLPACVIVKHANPCGVGVGGHDRGGLREGARRRPGLGLRRRRRAQPAGQRSARRAARRAVRRGAVRARLRRGGARGARPEGADVRILDDGERRAVRRGRARPTSACSAGCSSRSATRTPTRSTGWTSSAARPTPADWDDLLFAWAVVQARRLERDRDRPGRPDARDRRRPDEPRRRGADRGREGARARARARRGGARLRRVLPVRRRARSSRSTRASRAIIQPGGSKRDDEVIAAVRDAGATMVFTGRRHFRH